MANKESTVVSKKGEWFKGTYEVINKEKYIGKKAPIFRSSWERRMMYWCDMNINVIKWGSESIAIPYFYPIDKKVHKYYPDFYVEIRVKDGSIQKYITEVKPKKKTKPPKKPKNKNRKANNTYDYLMAEWIMNNAKWEAAVALCESKGIKFNIITEDHLF